MEPDDLIQELDAIEATPGAEEDCGCGGKRAVAADGIALDLDALERELDALDTSEPTDFGLDNLAQALDLEDDLDFALAIGDDEGGGIPTLEEVLALAKEYPGLKISFGF